MRRLFPILATIVSLTLVADLVVRLGWSIGLLSWISVPSTFLVHAIVFDYLRGSERRVQRMAKPRRWPDWIEAQSEKNRRKGWVAELGALPLIVVAAWPGDGLVPLLLFGGGVAYQIGAFVVEFVVINAQIRLIGEIEPGIKPPVALLNEIS